MGEWRCVRGLAAHVNTGIYACLISGAPVHMRAHTRTRLPFALRGRSSCCAGMVMSGMVFSVDVEAGASAQMHRQAGERVRKLADTSIPPLTATAVKAVATCALRLARALDLPRLPHGSNAGIDRPCMRCRAGGGAQSSVYAFPHASGKHAQDGVSKQRTGQWHANATRHPHVTHSFIRSISRRFEGDDIVLPGPPALGLALEPPEQAVEWCCRRLLARPQLCQA